jgi:hypothetical protein
MKTPYILNDDEICTVWGLVDSSCAISRKTTTQDLARLKARCEDFLAIPVVQALNSEGL